MYMIGIVLGSNACLACAHRYSWVDFDGVSWPHCRRKLDHARRRGWMSPRHEVRQCNLLRVDFYATYSKCLKYRPCALQYILMSPQVIASSYAIKSLFFSLFQCDIILNIEPVLSFVYYRTHILELNIILRLTRLSKYLTAISNFIFKIYALYATCKVRAALIYNIKHNVTP